MIWENRTIWQKTTKKGKKQANIVQESSIPFVFSELDLITVVVLKQTWWTTQMKGGLIWMLHATYALTNRWSPYLLQFMGENS